MGLRRCTCEFFSFSNGVHYLHFAGWDGPRHTEEVSASSTPVSLAHCGVSDKQLCVCRVRRFSPEVLGLCASTALVWIIIEVLVMLLCLYLLTVHSDLSTFDLIAYSGYKYVG